MQCGRNAAGTILYLTAPHDASEGTVTSILDVRNPTTGSRAVRAAAAGTAILVYGVRVPILGPKVLSRMPHEGRDDIPSAREHRDVEVYTPHSQARGRGSGWPPFAKSPQGPMMAQGEESKV